MSPAHLAEVCTVPVLLDCVFIPTFCYLFAVDIDDLIAHLMHSRYRIHVGPYSSADFTSRGRTDTRHHVQPAPV